MFPVAQPRWPTGHFAADAIKNIRLVGKLGQPCQEMQLRSPAHPLDAGKIGLRVPNTAAQQSCMHALVRQHRGRGKTGAICQDGPKVEEAVARCAIERPCGALWERPDNHARHVAHKAKPSRPVVLGHERDSCGNASDGDVALGRGGDRVNRHSLDDRVRGKSANERHDSSIDNEADGVHVSLSIMTVSV
jgi:hypothetical protein